MDAALQPIDMKLMHEAQKKFRIHGFEAFRLEATFSNNLHQLEIAKNIIGDDWNVMTKMLLRKGLIEMPAQGPTRVTSKAVRFLAIYSRPVFKN